MKAARFLATLLGSGLTGMLLYAAFAPIAFGPAAIAGIALLAVTTSRRRAAASFLLGWLAGFIFFALLFSWTLEATGEWLPRLALAAVEALYIGATAVGWRLIALARSRLPRARGSLASAFLSDLACAAVWVAFEQLRGEWPFGGMPWGTLAFSQGETPLLRLAPWGSTQLVGFTVVLIGLLAARAGTYLAGANLFSSSVAALLALAFFVAPVAVPAQSSAGEKITVGFAQGEVAPASAPLEWRERALGVTANLARASQAMTPGKIDLLLWPESASDIDIREDPEAREVVDGVAARLGVPILLGTQRYWEDPASGAQDGFSVSRRTNDYVVFTAQGEISGAYTKQHPVPFGEYMPYRDFFRQFSAAVDLVSVDMIPGSLPAVLDVPLGERTVRVATPICFEVAYNDISARAVREGAQLLVVPTNNASFGHSAESAQQFEMTRFRAVELGRTAIQVSTVGVSGIVEPDGVVHSTTDTRTEESRTATVGLRQGITFAAQFYELIHAGTYLLGSGVIALATYLVLVHGRKERKHQ